MTSELDLGGKRLRAHAAVQTAVQRGWLRKAPCEICGDARSMAHHDDYDRPLDVRWLCAKHHSQIHGAINASLHIPDERPRAMSLRQFRERLPKLDWSVGVYRMEGDGVRRKLGVWFPLPDEAPTAE